MSAVSNFSALQAQLRDARQPLRITGHGSKDFYGEALPSASGEVLSTLALNGITAYEPSELYLSALAGIQALRFDLGRRQLSVQAPEALFPAVESALARAATGGRPAALLDIGTGTGTLLREAALRWPGLGLVGLDGSRGMLEVAAAELGLDGIPDGRIELVEGLADRLDRSR